MYLNGVDQSVELPLYSTDGATPAVGSSIVYYDVITKQFVQVTPGTTYGTELLSDPYFNNPSGWSQLYLVV